MTNVRAAVAWAADRESCGARRRVQVALALIWLLDAALQYQPYMFTRAFATQVIEPAGAGSPGFIAHPAMFAGQLMLHNPVAFNALFATLQLALGLGLLWRRTVRAALLGGVAWALSIWWLGEGLGGMFSGTASPVSGTPGGAVLYALVAVLAWPAASRAASGGSVAAARSVAAGGLLGGRGAKLAWLAVWGSGAYLLLLAPNRAAGALRDAIAGGASGEPGWIAAIDRGAASAIGTSGTGLSVVLAVAFAVIAVGVLVPAATRPVLVLAMVTSAVIWVGGENFGGLATGQGTDPGNGPLLVLLAVSFWPLARDRRRSLPAIGTAGGPARRPAPAPASLPAPPAPAPAFAFAPGDARSAAGALGSGPTGRR